MWVGGAVGGIRYSNHVPGNKPPATYRQFAMPQYEFDALLMMTSLFLIKSLRIAVMCQGVNVVGLEAYNSSTLAFQ